MEETTTDKPQIGLTVFDLKVGFTFVYDLRQWKVTDALRIKFEDEASIRQLKITNGREIRYLEIDKRDKSKVKIYRKVALNAFRENLIKVFTTAATAPPIIHHRQSRYQLLQHHQATYKRILSEDDFMPYKYWEYAQDNSKYLAYIEQKQSTLEAYIGRTTLPSAISRLNPGEENVKVVGGRAGCLVPVILTLLLLLGTYYLTNTPTKNSDTKTYSLPTNDKAEALKNITTQFQNVSDYTILLQDMDHRADGFYHKYTTLIPEEDSLIAVTFWQAIPSKLFAEQKEELGMEVAHKSGNTLNVMIAPPGYSQFVGSERYGRWYPVAEDSIWIFNPFYNSLYLRLGLLNHSVTYSEWKNFQDNYKGKAPYYGEDRYYGTATYLKNTNFDRPVWGDKLPETRDSIINLSQSIPDN